MEHSSFMAKPRLGSKIAAAVLAAGVAVLLIEHFSEPSYQGKPLSFWLDCLVEDAHNRDTRWDLFRYPQRDSQAAQSVLAIGPRGIPFLLNWLRARDTPFKKKLRDFAKKHPWIPIEQWDPLRLRKSAMLGFQVLGPAAKSAVPGLIEALDDDDVSLRTAAAYALQYVGPSMAALPALEKRLNVLSQTLTQTNSALNEWETYGVLRALGAIGPEARTALPQIARLSQPPSPAIPAARAAYIKITGQRLDSALEPLNYPFAYPDWSAAYEVSAELGTNAAPAVPVLVSNLQDDNGIVQGQALFALAAIHSRPELCLPAMTPFLSSNDAGAAYVLDAISSFGHAATQWVSIAQITPCLTNLDERTRKEATNALLQVFPQQAAKFGIK
jgi:HEAT repeat protein